jgi:hypothetical protein
MSFPQSTPEITRWCALFVAIAMFFPAAAPVISLTEAERTGIVLYSSSPQLPPTERVTRTLSPDQFTDAVTSLWFHLLLCGSLSVVSFLFYRRLSS